MPKKPIKFKTILEFSEKVDELSDAKDYEKLELLLKQFSENEYDFESLYDEAQYYYAVGVCMQNIYKTQELEWFSDDLSQSVIFYRKALNAVQKIKHSTYESINLKSNIETNLGISLSSQGRVFCCLQLWQSAFKARNPVSIISLANNEMFIASSVQYSINKYIHYLTAYELIQLGLKHLDELHPEYKEAYSKSSNLMKFKTWFEENYSAEDFKEIERQQIENNKIKNKSYLEWCAKNRFFLNDLNNINSSELVYKDILSLPSFRSKFNDSLLLHEELAYHGNFEELKNDYCYARYLFFKAKQMPNEQVNMFNDTYPHVDDKSYALTNLKSQHYKTAFRILYSLFDKIAYFLYRYFDLKEIKKDKDVDFLKIFGCMKDKKWTPHDKFKDSKNVFIHGLFNILKDIRYVEHLGLAYTGKWLDPDAIAFYDIRNAIEHRSLKIVEDLGYEMIQHDRKYNQKNIDRLLDEIENSEIEIKNLTTRISLAKKEKNKELEIELESQKSSILGKLSLKKDKLYKQEKLSTHSVLVSVSDFESRLMTLMSLARNSIMYLSLAIQYEEKTIQYEEDKKPIKNLKYPDLPAILPREVPLK